MAKGQKPVHVWIPADLYEKFRIKLFKEGMSIKQKVQELISKYVNE